MIFLNINKVNVIWFSKSGNEVSVTTVEFEGLKNHPNIKFVSVDCPDVIDEEQAVRAGTNFLKQHQKITAIYNRHCLN